MENVTDALKMAAAMMIFVGALTITIFAFTKAREASTEIMAQKDRNRTFYNLDNVNITSEREVGVDAVISNMYSYYQTQNTIIFFTGNLDGGNLINVKPMPLYITKAFEVNLKKSSLTHPVNTNFIIGLDINDEAIRQEQWVNTETRRKRFIDLLLNGSNDIIHEMVSNPRNPPPDSIFSTSTPRDIMFNYSSSLGTINYNN